MSEGCLLAPYQIWGRIVRGVVLYCLVGPSDPCEWLIELLAIREWRDAVTTTTARGGEDGLDLPVRPAR